VALFVNAEARHAHCLQKEPFVIGSILMLSLKLLFVALSLA